MVRSPIARWTLGVLALIAVLGSFAFQAVALRISQAGVSRQVRKQSHGAEGGLSAGHMPSHLSCDRFRDAHERN
jgi:hypothetical protein